MVFAAVLEAPPLEPAPAVQREMKREAKTAQNPVKRHTKSVKHHVTTTNHHAKAVKHTKMNVQAKRPDTTPAIGGGM